MKVIPHYTPLALLRIIRAVPFPDAGAGVFTEISCHVRSIPSILEPDTSVEQCC